MKTPEQVVDEHIKRVERAHPVYANHFRKAYAGEASKRQAIQAKCLDCSNLDRNEIKECVVFTCPLWHYRPYQKPEETDAPCAIPTRIGDFQES